MEVNNMMHLLKKAKEGDHEAKAELVSLNIGLIWSIVKRFSNRGYELEDLFQIGSIGLIKAIQKFDFSYNVKFSTYADPMITGEIRRFIRDDNPIKVTRTLKELSFKIQKSKEALTVKLKREPTINELASEMNITKEELIMAMESSQTLLSLNDIAYQDDGSPIFFIDQIGTDEKDESTWFDRIALKEALSKLKKEERQIIILRYFKDLTQVQVAKMLGKTQVQVSREEKKILKKIRCFLS